MALSIENDSYFVGTEKDTKLKNCNEVNINLSDIFSRLRFGPGKFTFTGGWRNYNMFFCLFLLIGARMPDETVVNHKTKKCIRFHRGDACTPCNFIIQEGWVLAEGNLCPKGYENLTDRFEKKRYQFVMKKKGTEKDPKKLKQIVEDYFKVQEQAVKCDKPRNIPKCCNEPPFCS